MAFPFLEKPGQHQRQGNFHDFGRLNDDPDIQPAPRSFLDQPEHGDSQKQSDTEGINRHGKTHQRLWRNTGRNPPNGETDLNISQLVFNPPREINTCRIQGNNAYRHDQENDQRQRPVKNGQPAFSLLRITS